MRMVTESQTRNEHLDLKCALVREIERDNTAGDEVSIEMVREERLLILVNTILQKVT